MFSKTKGDISIKEKEQIKKNEFIKNFKETKLYKDVIEKFPDANLVDVISKKEEDEFIGRNMQKPPIFSAIKKDGKRLYEYARENKEIDIDEREIDIYNFEIIDFASPYVNFKIECSKGTYIRSIANDFGKRLNSGSYLYELRRTKIGDFCVLNAMDINIDVKT